MTDAEMDKLSAGAPDVLTDEQIDADGKAPPPPADDRGFFRRAGDTLSEGVHSLGNVAKDVGRQIGRGVGHALGGIAGNPEFTASVDQSLGPPLTKDQARARATELARGVDDITSLGYGQRAADAARRSPLVGRALGTAVETQAQQDTAAQQRSAEAPGYRTVGHVAGQAVPNVVSEIAKVPGLAMRAAGKVVPGAAAAAGRAGEKIVEQVARVPLVGRMLAPAASGAAGAAKSVAQYETTAPLISAASADAAGHREEAAHAAASDPLGLITSAAAGGVPAYLQREGGPLSVAASAVENSKGGKARKLIEERGHGAKVGLLSPGKGGVFDRELAGVPADDAGIGIAAKKGAIGIADTIEQQFQEKHGFPYREGRQVLKEAAGEHLQERKQAQRDAHAAALAYRDDVAAATNAVKTETAERARQILDHIDEEHAVETSKPYRVLKGMIDNSPAAVRPRDVTPIVTAMQDAAHDLETAPFVRSQLNEQLNILDRYRDPQTGAVMVPERQLNGLRRTLMRSAKIGMSDAPGEAEAPLRRAAYEAKRMVDEGPYKALNDLYAEGSAKRESARKAVGLPGKPSKSAAADEKRLVSTLRRSVDDQTAIPGPLPPEADVSQLRSALKAPEQARDAAMARVRARLESAEQRRGQVISHVSEAEKAAIPDRAALGLNSKIGTRKTDVNQIRLALQRQGDNTNTGGGNPSDLAAFRKEHPDQARNLDLPELQRAKADLSFHVAPQHGGLAKRIAGSTVGPLAAAGIAAAAHTPLGALAIPAAFVGMNAKPIAGRVLYPMAKGYQSAVARLARAARASASASDFIREAVSAGLGVNDARRIYEKAHPTAPPN